MKKTFFKILFLFILFGLMLTPVAGTAVAQGFSVDPIVLFPGDSRSIEFHFYGTLLKKGSFHVALITAVSPDEEIHQLTIQITPMGNLGTELAYFTWGAFINFTGGILDSFEILEPKYTYAYKNVKYVVNINPYMATGFLFTAPIVEYSHFDFPLNMAMTLTLSN